MNVSKQGQADALAKYRAYRTAGLAPARAVADVVGHFAHLYLISAKVTRVPDASLLAAWQAARRWLHTGPPDRASGVPAAGTGRGR